MQSELQRTLLKYKFTPLVSLLIVVLILFFLNKDRDSQLSQKNIILCKSISVDSIYVLTDSVVLPVLYEAVPDLRKIHYKERMQKFIDMMLPSVLMACKKMDYKREKIIELNAAVSHGVGTVKDSLYLEKVKKYYKTGRIEEVVNRLHAHPVSIILAQAAIESGWATSRFCREGNNIFGIWSYNSTEKRIKASESRGGGNIYLRRYDSLFESVYDYLETISRSSAYKQFREVRLYSNDPYRLIWYLSNYSEKRYEYVHVLRNVIEFNDLHQYDSYRLAKIKKSDEIWKALLD